MSKSCSHFWPIPFFWHSSVACLQLHWNNWVQVRSIIRFKRQVCWVYNYYHYDYCFFCYPQRDLKLWAGSSVHAVVRPCLPVEITMSTGWASQVALSCQEPPVVWGLKQPVAFWCPLDLVLLQSPSYSKFHPWHDVLPWSSLLLRLWHESCPQNAPLDRIWHYLCKDNPFVQDIQKPRLAMDAHQQIDLFDPFWGSSRASHSNNDGIWRDFSNFSPTRHQLMLLHRGNRQWLPPAEFPPWPQAPQAPVRSNASGRRRIWISHL